jgi:hypothetical protein
MTTAINRSAADAHGSGVSAATHYRTATVDGLNIFYREAGPKDAPVVLLLHGFPSSSHMFRNLVPLLADAYHVIAPDYPAFGHSDTPDRAQFTYSFDHIAEIIDDLLDALGVRRLAPYMDGDELVGAGTGGEDAPDLWRGEDPMDVGEIGDGCDERDGVEVDDVQSRVSEVGDVEASTRRTDALVVEAA